jgi:hypothetical protein
MDTREMTLEQIRWRGLKALSEELGPVGLVRFLQQFETGQGDYTNNRRRWLGGVTVDDLVQEIQDKKSATAED